MHKIVIDTNVIISAALTPGGNAGKIIKSVYEGKAQAYYNDEILDEYTRVLGYERLNIPAVKQKAILSAIENSFTLLEPVRSSIPLVDEDDRVFYDTAKASGAYLITGNAKHYPNESFIVDPSEYLQIIINSNVDMVDK